MARDRARAPARFEPNPSAAPLPPDTSPAVNTYTNEQLLEALSSAQTRAYFG